MAGPGNGRRWVSGEMTVSLSELDLAWALLGQQRYAEPRGRQAPSCSVSPNNVSAIACHAMALWKDSGDSTQPLVEIARRGGPCPPMLPRWRHNYATLLASQGANRRSGAAEFGEALRIKPDEHAGVLRPDAELEIP